MPEEIFPQEFLRGLSNKDFVDNGLVLPTAFQFDDANRDDHKKEASINWLDDDGAIDIALQQKKENGKIQFSAGLARLNLADVIFILRSIPSEMFSYERKRLPENPYHGNLLLAANMPKQMRQMVASGLALAAGTRIIPQTNQD